MKKIWEHLSSKKKLGSSPGLYDSNEPTFVPRRVPIGGRTPHFGVPVLQAAAIQTHQLSCRTEVGTPHFAPLKDCSLFVVFLVVLVVINGFKG